MIFYKEIVHWFHEISVLWTWEGEMKWKQGRAYQRSHLNLRYFLLKAKIRNTSRYLISGIWRSLWGQENQISATEGQVVGERQGKAEGDWSALHVHEGRPASLLGSMCRESHLLWLESRKSGSSPGHSEKSDRTSHGQNSTTHYYLPVVI